jgi:hypothetical protein
VKAGQVINGYTILEDFKVVGAGLSKWTFAERGGRKFFIKESTAARAGQTRRVDRRPDRRRRRSECGRTALARRARAVLCSTASPAAISTRSPNAGLGNL